MNIGVVVNPKAGSNRRDPEVSERLRRALGGRGTVAVPRSLDELDAAAEDFRQRGVTIVGIAGGDGTNHVTITRFAEVWGGKDLPTFAFLRGGTMNTVANSLGLPRGRPERLLDRLVLAALDRPNIPFVERPTLDVDGKLGFLWGMGVVPGFLKAYYDTGAPSPWTATKTLARAIGSVLTGSELVRKMTEPVLARVSVDGERWQPESFLALAAATIPDVGLGFRPFHRASDLQDRFHVLGIHTSPMGFIGELPRIHKALPMRADKAVDAAARTVTVTTDLPECSMMIDGDLFVHPKPTVTLRVGPTVRIAKA